MSLLLQILFWVAMFGTGTSTIYCLMVIAAAMRFGLRKRREDRAEATFLPALSVLKPLHGMEPGLERNIESFFYRTILSLSCFSARGTRAIKGCNWRGGWGRGIRRWRRGM